MELKRCSPLKIYNAFSAENVETTCSDLVSLVCERHREC